MKPSWMGTDAAWQNDRRQHEPTLVMDAMCANHTAIQGDGVKAVLDHGGVLLMSGSSRKGLSIQL